MTQRIENIAKINLSNKIILSIKLNTQNKKTKTKKIQIL